MNLKCSRNKVEMSEEEIFRKFRPYCAVLASQPSAECLAKLAALCDDTAAAELELVQEYLVFPAQPEEDMSENIRKRRGEKVTMNIPIFKDVNTLSPFREDLAAYGDDCSSAAAAKDDHIYLDAMGFGMGLCCLQLTFQVRPHRHYSGDT